MGTSKSKEAVIIILQEQARRLGKNTLTTSEVQAVISGSTLRTKFGSVGNAFESAGLKRQIRGANLRTRPPLLTDDQLFGSMFAVEQQLEKEPTGDEYSAFGAYSKKPFVVRFKKWSEALLHYRKWKHERGASSDSKLSGVPDQEDAEIDGEAKSETVVVRTSKSSRQPKLYGEPIEFRGLRHAPINEQGVVYLFGMVSRELGFSIEAIQTGFPDCEGKRMHDPKKNLWASARIEFEFKSSNFRLHGHNPDECDFIVCWEHDWNDCPVEVIELKNEIRKLPSR